MKRKLFFIIIFTILLTVSVNPDAGDPPGDGSTKSMTTRTTTTCNEQGICSTIWTDWDMNYHNGTEWREIDQMIYNKENESIRISGNIYKYGASDNTYHAYFRETSSNQFHKPAAIITQDWKYAITYDPLMYIMFEPHKGGKTGRVARRQRSDATEPPPISKYPEVSSIYELLPS